MLDGVFMDIGPSNASLSFNRRFGRSGLQGRRACLESGWRAIIQQTEERLGLEFFAGLFAGRKLVQDRLKYLFNGFAHRR
jgi:hypothetical protein